MWQWLGKLKRPCLCGFCDKTYLGVCLSSANRVKFLKKSLILCINRWKNCNVMHLMLIADAGALTTVLPTHWPWRLNCKTEVFNFWNFQKKWPVWDKLIAVGRFQSAGAKSGQKKSGYDDGKKFGRRSSSSELSGGWRCVGCQAEGGEAPRHHHHLYFQH